MTTPSTFNTPARCIEYAMKDAGLLQHGDLPDSEHLAEYGNRLNDLINLWQTQGLKLWLQQDLPLTVVAGTSFYSLGLTGTVVMTKPLRVIQAYSENTAGIARPLMLISQDEWTRLSSKISTGSVNSIFVNKQQTTLDINLWLVPDATAATEVIHLITQYQVTNSISLTDTINFPQEWFMALRWGLADDICSGQPREIMARCAQRASVFRQALEDWDVEDASTQFQPDGNSYTSSGRFR